MANDIYIHNGQPELYSTLQFYPEKIQNIELKLLSIL